MSVAPASVIPGTFEGDFSPPPFEEFGHAELRARFLTAGAKGLKFLRMGACQIIICREPAGENGEWLWHLSISNENRHPTWDEIKTARYRLLPLDRCFGMLLPPPEYYVNVPAQDHVFHVWEITDPREPWSAM